MDGGPMGIPPQPDMDEPNQFDTNFDPGVEADEQNDPKHFIQQLTGKLSQSLRSYNSELPQPDIDLSKYVAGMILKQTTDGLSPDDKNEILNKVNGDGDDKEPQIGESVRRDILAPEEDDKADKVPSKKKKTGIRREAVTPPMF